MTERLIIRRFSRVFWASPQPWFNHEIDFLFVDPADIPETVRGFTRTGPDRFSASSHPRRCDAQTSVGRRSYRNGIHAFSEIVDGDVHPGNGPYCPNQSIETLGPVVFTASARGSKIGGGDGCAQPPYLRAVGGSDENRCHCIEERAEFQLAPIRASMFIQKRAQCEIFGTGASSV
jgi:hypothetical protein